MRRRAPLVRAPRDERGATALELAFLAPGLLLLIFFCVQGALYFYGHNVAIQAAREGVSELRLAQDASTYDALLPQVKTKTEGYATTVGSGGLNGSQVTFGPEPDYDSQFPRASVTVKGTTITLVPWLELHVTATASGPVERFESGAPGAGQ